MAVKIVEVSPVSLKNPAIVEGFPGLGLVGTISASYLVEKLKMDFVGYVTSDQFPPLAAVHNYEPLYPSRIYASKKHNLYVFISEFIIPLPAVYALADAIWDFAKAKKASKIISLGGISLKGEEGKVYAIASSQKLSDELERHHLVSLIKEGATTGVTGVLLTRGAVEKFPVLSLLAPAHGNYMDPKAAAVVLEVLKAYLRLEFDTTALEKESAIIEDKMKEMLSRAKQSHNHYNKTVQEHASLGSMYG